MKRIWLVIVVSVLGSSSSVRPQEALDAAKVINLYDRATSAISSYDVRISARWQYLAKSTTDGRRVTNERLITDGKLPEPHRYILRQAWQRDGWKRRYEVFDLKKSEKQPFKVCVMEEGIARSFHPHARTGTVMNPMVDVAEAGMEYFNYFRGIDSIVDGPTLLRTRLPSVTARKMTDSNLVVIDAPAQPKNRDIGLAHSGFRIFLDPEHSFLPRLIECWAESENGPLLEWRLAIVEFAKHESGMDVPVRATHEAFGTNKGWDTYGKVFSRVEAEVDQGNSRWNVDLPRETFQLTFPSGTLVSDTTQKVRYIAGKSYPGENVKDLVRHAQEVVPLDSGIPLHPRPSWWGDSHWHIALGLSAIAMVVCAAAIWYWRTRRRRIIS